jgi:hypothetical protein
MIEPAEASPATPLWSRMLCTWLTASVSSASEALRLRDQTVP